jgi:hypothetical protein
LGCGKNGKRRTVAARRARPRYNAGAKNFVDFFLAPRQGWKNALRVAGNGASAVPKFWGLFGVALILGELDQTHTGQAPQTDVDAG